VGGHLLIPFGVERWRIEDVKVSGVSTDATYFESSAPLCHIDMSTAVGLRLYQVDDVLPNEGAYPLANSVEANLEAVQTTIVQACQFDADSERLFLNLYFKYLLAKAMPQGDRFLVQQYRQSPPASDPKWAYEALLPLPQAHLYLRDPLSRVYSFSPERMYKVDFAFWTGKRLVAVEIDGKSHIGSTHHIVKDRLLQSANVQVIHIMNEELLHHGEAVIQKLLPREIARWWEHLDDSDRPVPSYGPYEPF
jgi:hypothetical protein